MKHVSCVLFCAILLCCPVLRSQSVLTLSADDVKFLSGCGVRQDDIKAIPNLPSDGQDAISLILSNKNRKCSYLKHFIDSRDFLRQFTPPPSECPVPPNDYEWYFLTPAELEYINKVDKDILDRILEKMH